MLLQLLPIKNLALVEDLEWRFRLGSRLSQAKPAPANQSLSARSSCCWGERADKSLVRTGAKMCTVEEIFQGNDFAKWNARFEESGIESCGHDLILKRSLSLSGTNRQFINGSPTTLRKLQGAW